MTYEENKQEWIKQFSVEKNIDNLFLVKNHISNTFTVATNFDLNSCSYHGQIFHTTTKKEQAFQIFAEILELTLSNSKVGVMP